MSAYADMWRLPAHADIWNAGGYFGAGADGGRAAVITMISVE
jgi:hypothetical protein